MVFTVLTLCQMGHVLAIRAERESFLQRGPWSNPLLLGAVLLFALQMATIYVPVLNPIFHIMPLTLYQLGLCLMLSTMVFLAVKLGNELGIADDLRGNTHPNFRTISKWKFILSSFFMPANLCQVSIHLCHSRYLLSGIHLLYTYSFYPLFGPQPG